MFLPTVRAASPPLIRAHESCIGVIPEAHEPPRRLAPSKHLSLVIAIPIGMTFGMFSLLIAVLAGSSLFLPPANTNPLAALDTLIRNDHRAILSLYPQGCPYGIPTEQTPDDTLSCAIRPLAGALRSIEVTLRHRIIERVTAQADGLQVGDLVRHWGRPDVIERHDQQVTLRWGSRIYATASALGRFTYLASVQSIDLSLAAG